MILEKSVTGRWSDHIFIDYKDNRLVCRQGGYFCGLWLSLPNVYPILKQVKPKLITAMKSTILIGLAEIGQIKIDGADQLSFTVFGKKIIKNTRWNGIKASWKE